MKRGWMVVIRFIKEHAPAFVVRPMLSRLDRRYRGKSTAEVFDAIYRKQGWGGRESLSGQGSDLPQTENVRRALPGLIEELNVESMLDAPCGDFHWMSHIDLAGCQYVGVDIVPALIDANRRAHQRDNVRFDTLDIVKDDLPKVDLILCRDCFIHLSFDLIWAALRQFKKSGSRFLLTTTFPNVKRNIDITTGGCRKLNLQRPPFSFPEPMKLINDAHEIAEEAGGSIQRGLGLWELAALNV